MGYDCLVDVEWGALSSPQGERNVLGLVFIYLKSPLPNVRNEEVLPRVNEQRNILREIRKRQANWIGHILRRNCLLKRVIEGKKKGGI